MYGISNLIHSYLITAEVMRKTPEGSHISYLITGGGMRQTPVRFNISYLITGEVTRQTSAGSSVILTILYVCIFSRNVKVFIFAVF